ncbi:quinone oxidoreductase [Marinobacterium nitratireducens]|uniref:Quinone oxidoreductase n=1 Tax=Marinobacterium nitratireducens TaxID=518897 RepID=A0A918DQF8_9GAMM|nr:NADP-dependent oxidoreductase [Marinobacterium nitratireducens]GGO77260.1 quinone oxidoreductase [Marinobacterium nitratireducens]
MKASRIHAFGGPDALTCEEVPTPVIGDHEVLVRNRAAGINPIDWKTCSGGGAAAFIGKLPFIPGWEFAGIIEMVGTKVESFAPGDEVFGFIRFPEAAGCYAEYVAAPVAQIARKPSSLSFSEAAGLGLAGLTAWQALHDKGQLQAGETVLVLAAAGGVGHLAVQLARAAGAEVIGSASATNHDYLRSLGCSRLIDYHTQDLATEVQGADLVIDGIGGEVGISALSCLKEGGRLVTLPSVTADAVIRAAEGEGKQALGIRVEPNGQQLAELARLCSDGQLKLTLAGEVPLENAREAHQQSAGGHVRGKLVLTI